MCSVGNPLAQEIMILYQEPDGTRRLLNYLLDNLAGTKRGESASTRLVVIVAVIGDIHVSIRLLITSLVHHSMDPTVIFIVINHF